jgi:hypothetical protein
VPNFHLAFVDDEREEYLQYNVTTDATVTRNFVDVAGQNKHQVWIDASQDWLTLYAGPKAKCDVYAACGPFTVCSYAAALQPCSCMMGFSVRSERDWEQGDRAGGCVRDAPLDCNSTRSDQASSSTDGFFSMPSIGLPDRGHSLINVRSSAECSTACLSNCPCTAYSYGSQGGCFVWLDGWVYPYHVSVQHRSTQNNPKSMVLVQLLMEKFFTFVWLLENFRHQEATRSEE